MNHMDRKLYEALVYDHIDVLKGMNWLEVRNQLTPSNNTVLHLACQHGSKTCVQEILHVDNLLLSKINLRDETALHLAARQGHYGAVKALINKAKSPVPQPNDLENISSTVPQPNDLENTSSTALQNLIRAPNVELETAMHAAVRYNHQNVVELIVKEDPSYSYPQNKYNETPLYLAAVRHYAGVMKVILDNSESLSFGGPDGRTALHATLMSSDRANACTRLLLEKNKDLIKAADNNGWTAFHFAAHNNLYKSVKFLLKEDKSVAYLTDEKYKRTALHVAAYKGHDDVLKKFLKHLPDAWEIVDGNGQNILHIAVKQHQKSVVKFILSVGFDMKNTLLIQRDKEGNTPLHLIAKFGCYFPELQNTRDWNADWDVVDDTNFTPKDLLHQKHEGTLIDEELVAVAIDKNDVEDHWKGWITNKGHGYGDENQKPDKEMVNTHMIVAALITTVALTAGFTMPGGFDGNHGPNQGSALLLRKTAFKTFMVADTIALVFSISSLFLYFLCTFNFRRWVLFISFAAATAFNVISITAMMVAFIAGTSAVLSDSSGLTITVLIISSLFLLLVFYVCFRFFRIVYKIFKSVYERVSMSL